MSKAMSSGGIYGSAKFSNKNYDICCRKNPTNGPCNSLQTCYDRFIVVGLVKLL